MCEYWVGGLTSSLRRDDGDQVIHSDVLQPLLTHHLLTLDLQLVPPAALDQPRTQQFLQPARICRCSDAMVTHMIVDRWTQVITKVP